MKPQILAQVTRHGNQLIQLFNLSIDPVKLCRALRRLEAQANRINTLYCNGDIEMEYHEKQSDVIEERVKKLFNNSDMFTAAFYYNSDPRGYALKLHEEWTRVNAPDLYKDWGGYGILAPEFK